MEPEAQAAEEYYEEADDGLGYYPDGTKRTLTDEQIAMFRHSEIQAILRKRRLREENGELSDAEFTPAIPAPLSSAQDNSLHMVESVDKTQSDANEKPKQQWATTSAASKAKAKRKRNKYAKRRKERRLERGLPRRRGDRNGTYDDDSGDSDEESDEWDAWHQAHGPDVQKNETMDLDY